MSERTFVGVNPWLPWPLSGWRWWTEPVRAERLAVLRIALGLVLLWDILWNYLPHAADFFGARSLGSPEMFDYLAEAPRWRPSVESRARQRTQLLPRCCWTSVMRVLPLMSMATAL